MAKVINWFSRPPLKTSREIIFSSSELIIFRFKKFIRYRLVYGGRSFEYPEIFGGIFLYCSDSISEGNPNFSVFGVYLIKKQFEILHSTAWLLALTIFLFYLRSLIG